MFISDLCQSCRHMVKISGYGREIKMCRAIAAGVGAGDVVINFPVEKCSSYEEKGSLSRYDMEEMAIYIEKKKDAPGFRFTRHVRGEQIEFK